MFDFMNSLCMLANGAGYWLLTFMGIMIVFSLPLMKLLSREGTWKRARTTGFWFLVAFVVLGTFPANLWWLKNLVVWLYGHHIMWVLLGASSFGLILSRFSKCEDWKAPSTAVFVPTFLWAFGFVSYHTILV